MKTMALALTCCIAVAAAGQQKTDTTATQYESPLVRAAKAAGGARKMPKKVITNADVKKSTGKLVILPGKADGSVAAAPPVPPLPIEQHEALLRAENAAGDRVRAAEKNVSELEKEARRLEDAYYAENDPNYRDTVIATRFRECQRRLDAARKKLDDARDAEAKLTAKP